jgi:hypothetical protein
MNVFHASDLRNIFANEFPRSLEISILQALDAAYKETRNHLMRFRYPEAKDLRGHYVRACFEDHLKQFAVACSSVTVESRLNSRKSSYHTRVKSGRLHLTASAVRQQSERPRKALFRSTYASEGQLSILESPRELSEDSGEPIYGVLRYGPSSTPFPLFATIACPDANESKYIHITDLMAKHPGVIDLSGLGAEEYQEEPIPEIFVSPSEDIQEPELPGLRPIEKRAGEEGS